MWDTLHDGDHVLMDRSYRRFRGDGIYVFQMDDALIVKRLSRNPRTRLLTVKGDNSAYPVYDSVRDDDLQISGKVIWLGRKI